MSELDDEIARLRWMLDVMEKNPPPDGLFDEEYEVRRRLDELLKLAGARVINLHTGSVSESWWDERMKRGRERGGDRS